MKRRTFDLKVKINGEETTEKTYYKLRAETDTESILTTTIFKSDTICCAYDTLPIIYEEITKDPLVQIYADMDELQLHKITFKEFKNKFGVFIYFRKSK